MSEIRPCLSSDTKKCRFTGLPVSPLSSLRGLHGSCSIYILRLPLSSPVLCMGIAVIHDQESALAVQHVVAVHAPGHTSMGIAL